jgi:hypothetical protein
MGSTDSVLPCSERVSIRLPFVLLSNLCPARAVGIIKTWNSESFVLIFGSVIITILYIPSSTLWAYPNESLKHRLVIITPWQIVKCVYIFYNFEYHNNVIILILCIVHTIQHSMNNPPFSENSRYPVSYNVMSYYLHIYTLFFIFTFESLYNHDYDYKVCYSLLYRVNFENHQRSTRYNEITQYELFNIMDNIKLVTDHDNKKHNILGKNKLFKLAVWFSMKFLKVI